jgi:cell division transport system permease protein
MSVSEISKVKPNFWYAIISVALVLFLLGFFGMLLLHTSALIQFYKEQLPITIELKNNVDAAVITDLQQKLSRSTIVKAGSIRMITKEEGLQMMNETNKIGTELANLGLENPLYNVIVFHVQANYLQPDSLRNLRLRIKKNDAVQDVYYADGVVETISKNIRNIGYMSLGVASIFILIAISLIHQTIRLALYSNRFLIKTMELVGASWDFISRPYLRQGIKNGFYSALIAIAALLLLLWWLQKELPDLKQLQNTGGMLALCLFLILLGIGITTLSTYIVIHKYLKMKSEDMY